MDKKTTIEKMVREAYEKGLFNGTWLYAEHGEIITKGAFGWRDTEDRLPMREDSIFDLASVSKQFTAAAIMLLVQEGRLGLEDEITQFFPGLPYPGVTVRQLLTHTGGVADYFDDINWLIGIWEKEDRIPDNNDVLRFLCESGAEAYFAPGEDSCYSNSDYCLLALIVERVSGLPFEDFMKRRVFEPAGMRDTAVCHVRRDGWPSDNFARAMVLEDGRYLLPDFSQNDRDVIPEDGTSGDGNVYSNIFDLFRWDRVLREGRLLTPETQRLMYAPVKLNSGEEYADEEGEGYGFGWAIPKEPEQGLIVEHGGWHKGAHTRYERFIDKDLVLIILLCRDPEDTPAFEAFFKAIREIMRGREPEPFRTLEERMVRDPDKSAWASFCGKFAHEEDDCFYPDEVFLRDGELYVKWMRGHGAGFTWRLYPLGGDEFGIKKFDFTLRLSAEGLTVFDELYKKA